MHGYGLNLNDIGDMTYKQMFILHGDLSGVI